MLLVLDDAALFCAPRHQEDRQSSNFFQLAVAIPKQKLQCLALEHGRIHLLQAAQRLIIRKESHKKLWRQSRIDGLELGISGAVSSSRLKASLKLPLEVMILTTICSPES
jgi:hypothetical protein